MSREGLKVSKTLSEEVGLTEALMNSAGDTVSPDKDDGESQRRSESRVELQLQGSLLETRSLTTQVATLGDSNDKAKLVHDNAVATLQDKQRGVDVDVAAKPKKHATKLETTREAVALLSERSHAE